MNIKRIAGYTLLTILVIAYFRLVILKSPWWVLPLGLFAGGIIIGLFALISWLIKLDTEPKPITEKQLLDFGFKKIGHFTVMNSLIYDLDWDISLSLGCVGTPNEMLFLREGDGSSSDQLIVLHNFDYHGVLTMDKLVNLINWFETRKEKKLPGKSNIPY